MAEMEWRRRRSYAKPEYRPKRDTVNPCRLCGWSAHMAIHEDGEGLQSTDPKLAHRYQPPPTRLCQWRGREAMKLSKAQRAALREKFEGLCAYCGKPLGERWHADHVEPLVRNDWGRMPSKTPEWPERDTLENMNPACAPCNIDKHSLSLESWRQMIQRTNEVLYRDVSTFRRAVRYGLVGLNTAPVVFYFETRAAAEIARAADAGGKD